MNGQRGAESGGRQDDGRTPGEWVYRTLLRLLPAWFRDRYGPELIEAFRLDRRRAPFLGRLGAVRFWLHSARDLCGTAYRERRTPSPLPSYERGRPAFRIISEARHAARGLRRTPAFTMLATLTLGLGIGAVSTAYTVVDGVLLAPLPLPQADELVRVWERERDNPNARMVAYGNWVDLRASARGFEDLAIWRFSAHTLTGEGDAVRLRSRGVSANFNRVLGTQPLHGRWISEDETRDGGRVAVLGFGLWQARFGTDPAVLGASIQLEGEPFTVVGVMPPGFDYPSGAEIWVPLSPVTDPVGARAWHMHSMVGRLEDDVDLASAQRDLDLIARRLERAYPASNAGNFFEIQPLRDSIVGSVRHGLTILAAACALLLLIACVNIASLFLARVTARQREFATRSALGASRAQLRWFVLWEGLLLGTGGSALGLALTAAACDLVRRMGSGVVPRVDDIRLGLPVFGLSALAAVTCAVLVSLGPLIQRRPGYLQGRLALRQGGASEAVGTIRSRRRLVVAQLSLAIVLVVGAGLLLKSLGRLGAVRTGVEDENALITMDVRVPRVDDEEVTSVLRVGELVRALVAQPGVSRAAAVLTEPVDPSGWYWNLTIRERPLPTADLPPIGYNIVTPGYFETMGVPVLQGRGFEAGDVAGAERVAIVNRAAAERHWPGESPLGRQILGSVEGDSAWARVIGVIDDIRQSLTEPPSPEVFVPLGQNPVPGLVLVARVTGHPDAIAPVLERAVRDFDPDIPVANAETLASRIGATISRPRFNAALMSVFGGVALLLACVGVYSVLSYTVAQRRREFGIRMAIGADRLRVLASVMREASAIALAATLLGLLAAVATARLIRGLLFEVTPVDASVFGAVGALVLLVALLAGLGPAWSATSVDPAITLREE